MTPLPDVVAFVELPSLAGLVLCVGVGVFIDDIDVVGGVVDGVVGAAVDGVVRSDM